MKKHIAAALLAALCWPAATLAQGEPLGKCLADNTTGKDRKDLARWIFVAMAAHPEISELANANAAAAEQTSRAMGQLVTRLLTQACVKEVQAAAKAGGTVAMRQAFETLGQVAMMELTSNRDVAASISGFERYVDRAKISALMEGR